MSAPRGARPSNGFIQIRCVKCEGVLNCPSTASLVSCPCGQILRVPVMVAPVAQVTMQCNACKGFISFPDTATQVVCPCGSRIQVLRQAPGGQQQRHSRRAEGDPTKAAAPKKRHSRPPAEGGGGGSPTPTNGSGGASPVPRRASQDGASASGGAPAARQAAPAEAAPSRQSAAYNTVESLPEIGGETHSAQAPAGELEVHIRGGKDRAAARQRPALDVAPAAKASGRSPAPSPNSSAAIPIGNQRSPSPAGTLPGKIGAGGEDRRGGLVLPSLPPPPVVPNSRHLNRRLAPLQVSPQPADGPPSFGDGRLSPAPLNSVSPNAEVPREHPLREGALYAKDKESAASINSPPPPYTETATPTTTTTTTTTTASAAAAVVEDAPAPAPAAAAPVQSYSGWLKKRGRVSDSWTKMYCELQGPNMKFFDQVPAQGGVEKGTINIADCMLTEAPEPGIEFPITLMQPQREYRLAAENQADKDKWWGLLAALTPLPPMKGGPSGRQA